MGQSGTCGFEKTNFFRLLTKRSTAVEILPLEKHGLWKRINQDKKNLAHFHDHEFLHITKHGPCFLQIKDYVFINFKSIFCPLSPYLTCTFTLPLPPSKKLWKKLLSSSFFLLNLSFKVCNSSPLLLFLLKQLKTYPSMEKVWILIKP